MLNVITGFGSNLLKIKTGKLPKAVWKGRKKRKIQPSTAFFIFTLPHSCQVNLISLCFMKNPKTSPKPILYSQKVLNKFTFTIIHNYFFWSHKSSSNFTFHLFWCVLTCNLSPNWNDSDKITTTFLISKMFPSCPSFILICVATSSLCTMLILFCSKNSLSYFSSGLFLWTSGFLQAVPLTTALSSLPTEEMPGLPTYRPSSSTTSAFSTIMSCCGHSWQGRTDQLDIFYYKCFYPSALTSF